MALCLRMIVCVGLIFSSLSWLLERVLMCIVSSFLFKNALSGWNVDLLMGYFVEMESFKKLLIVICNIRKLVLMRYNSFDVSF